MNLTPEIVKAVAKNARIKLSEKEVETFLPQLKEILDVFDKIKNVDTAKTKPSFQPITVKNITRSDDPKKSLDHETIFRGIKNKKDAYFVGPKTF